MSHWQGRYVDLGEGEALPPTYNRILAQIAEASGAEMQTSPRMLYAGDNAILLFLASPDVWRNCLMWAGSTVATFAGERLLQHLWPSKHKDKIDDLVNKVELSVNAQTKLAESLDQLCYNITERQKDQLSYFREMMLGVRTGPESRYRTEAGVSITSADDIPGAIALLSLMSPTMVECIEEFNQMDNETHYMSGGVSLLDSGEIVAEITGECLRGTVNYRISLKPGASPEIERSGDGFP